MAFNDHKNKELHLMREKKSPIKNIFATYNTVIYENCHSKRCWPSLENKLPKKITNKQPGSNGIWYDPSTEEIFVCYVMHISCC